MGYNDYTYIIKPIIIVNMLYYKYNAIADVLFITTHNQSYYKITIKMYYM